MYIFVLVNIMDPKGSGDILERVLYSEPGDKSNVWLQIVTGTSTLANIYFHGQNHIGCLKHLARSQVKHPQDDKLSMADFVAKAYRSPPMI